MPERNFDHKEVNRVDQKSGRVKKLFEKTSRLDTITKTSKTDLYQRAHEEVLRRQSVQKTIGIIAAVKMRENTENLVLSEINSHLPEKTSHDDAENLRVLKDLHRSIHFNTKEHIWKDLEEKAMINDTLKLSLERIASQVENIKNPNLKKQKRKIGRDENPRDNEGRIALQWEFARKYNYPEYPAPVQPSADSSRMPEAESQERPAQEHERGLDEKRQSTFVSLKNSVTTTRTNIDAINTFLAENEPRAIYDFKEILNQYSQKIEESYQIAYKLSTRYSRDKHYILDSDDKMHSVALRLLDKHNREVNEHIIKYLENIGDSQTRNLHNVEIYYSQREKYLPVHINFLKQNSTEYVKSLSKALKCLNQENRASELLNTLRDLDKDTQDCSERLELFKKLQDLRTTHDQITSPLDSWPPDQFFGFISKDAALAYTEYIRKTYLEEGSIIRKEHLEGRQFDDKQDKLFQIQKELIKGMLMNRIDSLKKVFQEKSQEKLRSLLELLRSENNPKEVRESSEEFSRTSSKERQESFNKLNTYISGKYNKMLNIDHEAFKRFINNCESIYNNWNEASVDNSNLTSQQELKKFEDVGQKLQDEFNELKKYMNIHSKLESVIESLDKKIQKALSYNDEYRKEGLEHQAPLEKSIIENIRSRMQKAEKLRDEGGTYEELEETIKNLNEDKQNLFSRLKEIRNEFKKLRLDLKSTIENLKYKIDKIRLCFDGTEEDKKLSTIDETIEESKKLYMLIYEVDEIKPSNKLEKTIQELKKDEQYLDDKLEKFKMYAQIPKLEDYREDYREDYNRCLRKLKSILTKISPKLKAAKQYTYHPEYKDANIEIVGDRIIQSSLLLRICSETEVTNLQKPQILQKLEEAIQELEKYKQNLDTKLEKFAGDMQELSISLRDIKHAISLKLIKIVKYNEYLSTNEKEFIETLNQHIQENNAETYFHEKDTLQAKHAELASMLEFYTDIESTFKSDPRGEGLKDKLKELKSRKEIQSMVGNIPENDVQIWVLQEYFQKPQEYFQIQNKYSKIEQEYLATKQDDYLKKQRDLRQEIDTIVQSKVEAVQRPLNEKVLPLYDNNQNKGNEFSNDYYNFQIETKQARDLTKATTEHHQNRAMSDALPQLQDRQNMVRQLAQSEYRAAEEEYNQEGLKLYIKYKDYIAAADKYKFLSTEFQHLGDWPSLPTFNPEDREDFLRWKTLHDALLNEDADTDDEGDLYA